MNNYTILHLHSDLSNGVTNINEIWKDINGYEGYYQVSNLGRIKSLIGWNGHKYIHREKIIKQLHRTNGYYFVGLHKNQNTITIDVHRLVALTFIPNPQNYPCVMHKDENLLNNNVNNLEWGTQKENCNAPLHKKRLSKSMSKKYGELNNFYGHKHTNKTKEKISNSRIGKYTKGENPNAKKVICDNIVFNSIIECAEYYDVSPKFLCSILQKIRNNTFPYKTSKWLDKGLNYYE
jgi:hypothetical protein